jgi:hypothetical protein
MLSALVQADLPPPDASFGVPVRVLQRRFRRKGDKMVPQGLIQWTDQPESLATWENLEELRQCFLWPQLGEKLCSKRGGM